MRYFMELTTMAQNIVVGSVKSTALQCRRASTGSLACVLRQELLGRVVPTLGARLVLRCALRCRSRDVKWLSYKMNILLPNDIY